MTDKDEKPRRGRPRKLDKAKVAEAAMQAYWEEGPTEVSLNAICHRAGVSKPSVYRDFGNDDGLTQAALHTYAETVLVQLLAITESDARFTDKLRRIAHLSAEDPLHEHGCLFVKMRAAKGQLGPKTQELIGQMDAMALEAFTKVLEDGRATGAWSGTIPIELAAKYLHAQVGLALDQRARGEDPKAILDLALSVLEQP